jgi:phosphoribosylformylglycinamidine cyclo-ligase
MPGVYAEGEFDLAGCIVGRVAEENLIDGSAIQAGDRIWGLPSSGLHTNGYTLARTVLLEPGDLNLNESPPGLDRPLGEALLAVHRSYLTELRRIWEAHGRSAVHGLAHITGGGFYDNVPRIIPAGATAVIETEAWAVPPLFRLIAERGEVAWAEMYRVFNMGIGMVLFLPAEVDPTGEADLDAILIGQVRAGDDTRVEVKLPA